MIVICDKSSNPPRATFAKIFLGSSGQLKADTSTTIVLINGESVDVPAPTIPAGNHRANHLAIHFRDEEGGWTLRKEAFDMLFTVRRARM